MRRTGDRRAYRQSVPVPGPGGRGEIPGLPGPMSLEDAEHIRAGADVPAWGPTAGR